MTFRSICTVAEPGVGLWLGMSAAFFLFFVFLPLLHPGFSIVFGATLPHAITPSFRLHVGYALIVVGDFAGLTKFLLLSAFSLLNEFVMGLEETLLPSLLAPQTHGVGFILGHQRSGTTALHAALLAHPQTFGATLFDIACPALALKALLAPVRGVLDMAMRAHDSALHRIRAEEPAEEHVFCLHHCSDHALFMLFPSLARHPRAPDLFREALTFSDADMLFMRRCIQRVTVASRLFGRGGALYVARPLSLTRDAEQLLEAFPGAKVAVCVLDGAATVRSWLHMYAAASHVPPDDPHFVALMRVSVEGYSAPTLDAALRLAERGPHDEVRTVLFDEWTRNPAAVLSSVLSCFLGETVAETDLLTCGINLKPARAVGAARASFSSGVEIPVLDEKFLLRYQQLVAVIAAAKAQSYGQLQVN